MRSTRAGSRAIAVAGRLVGASNAVSPSNVPGPAKISSSLAPSGLSDNEPCCTTKAPSAVSPALNSTCPVCSDSDSAAIAKLRNAPPPSRRKVGTRSNKPISSSMLMNEPRSRHEFVAAGFGHQDGRHRGILFDLLPQPVDVSLERVGGDAGIVAPDFLQQRFARHRPLPGAVQIAQDRGLLLGQAIHVALGIEQKFRARPERVGPDGEDGVLARFML